jgi:hypothetical protein
VSSIQDGIRNDQPGYRLAANDMRFDNLIHVVRLDASVPDGFRVNDHRGTQLALIEAPGFVRAHGCQASLRQFSFEQALQFSLSSGIAAAARVTFLALIHADKNMLAEFRHALV